MTEKNQNKLEKLDSPVMGFFLDFISYIILAVITFIIGFATSVYFQDFTHLGRAGAIISLMAISMAYKDFYLDLKNMSFEDAVEFIGKDKLFEIWSSSFVHKKRDLLEIIKPNFSEADALKLLDNIKDGSKGEFEGKDEFLEAWLKEMFRIWSKKLRGWEFTMLKIGTVLWAFSDLINNPLGW